MSDVDHDDLDEALGAALRRRAGNGTTSIDNAHHAVLARASHLRRRRAALAGGSAMVVMIVGGFMLLPRDNADTLAPADRPEDSSTIDSATRVPKISSDDSSDGSAVRVTVAPVGEPETSSTPQSTTPKNSSPSSVPARITPGGSTPRTSAFPGTTPATTNPHDTTGATAPSTSLPSTSSSPSTASEPSDPPPAPFTKTYNSEYGSITVSWSGSSLSLGAVSPVSGATAGIENQEALRVRVRFFGDGESRIEIRINGSDVIETIS